VAEGALRGTALAHQHSMTPLAVLPIWADTVESRACRILMFRDRWEIEVSAFGSRVANAEVSSFEAAFDLADQCRPKYVKATLKES
jgi:hypothetical protein